MSLLLLFQATGSPPPTPTSPDIGQSAALVISVTGSEAGSALATTGKIAFTNLIEVDLAVSAVIGFAVDTTRLLIVSLGDGITGSGASLPILDIGSSATTVLSAVGVSASIVSPITGKLAFVNVVEVDLAVSALIGLAIDATRLLIVSVGDAATGTTSALPTVDIGATAALVIATTGAASGSALSVTGKIDFTNVIEVDLAVSALVNLAVDATRLLIVRAGDGWTGTTSALNV